MCDNVGESTFTSKARAREFHTGYSFIEKLTFLLIPHHKKIALREFRTFFKIQLESQAQKINPFGFLIIFTRRQ